MNIKYNLTYKKDYNISVELDPHDYIYVETVANLYSRIKNQLYPKDLVDVNKCLSEKVDIPKEFIDEWKKLVGFIPGNVMTYNRKDRFINYEGVYTQIYTGEYLNSMKHNYSYHDFNFNDYTDFVFDNKSEYKCYLIQHDHWEYTSTTLLFAEKIN